MLTVAALADLHDAFSAAVAPPPAYTPVAWAEENLTLSERSTNFPGPLRLRAFTSYLVEPVNAIADPAVEHITLCFASQVAKTIGLMTMLGYIIDHDPGPTLWIMPNELDAKSFSQTRLQPLIEDCPRLARHKPADKDLFKLLEMHFARMSLNLVGANSPARVASRPIRYLFRDELDKYKLATEREAGTAALALHRTRSYAGSSKIVDASTPTVNTGEIWTGYEKGDQRKYHVPCPHCEKLQTLETRQVRWPNDLKGSDGLYDLDRATAEAWYECAFCDKPITSLQKRRIIRKGRWIATKQYRKKSGSPTRHISMQLPAICSPWVDVGHVAAAFLATRNSGSPADLQDFTNSWEALPWTLPGTAIEEDEVLKHRAAYAANTCPSAAPDKILMTADVQRQSFWYVIRAWGGVPSTSWKLRHGQVATWEDLHQVYLSRFIGPQGQEFRCTHGLVDSGDGETTEDVYRACAKYKWVPSKGYGGEGHTQPYRWTQLANGMILLSFWADYYKAALQFRLQIHVDDPGAWLLDAETGPDFAKQLASEKLVSRVNKAGRMVKQWILTHAHAPNHLLDCEVMQLVLRSILPISGGAAEAPAHQAAGGFVAPRDAKPFIRQASRRNPGQGFIRRKK